MDGENKNRCDILTEQITILRNLYSELCAEEIAAAESVSTEERENSKAELEKREDRLKELTKKIDEMMEQPKTDPESILKKEEEKVTMSDQQRVILEQSSRIEKLTADLVALNKNMEKITAERNELKIRLDESDFELRSLHNTIQDLKGRIRVFCRIRRRTEEEKALNRKYVFKFKLKM